MPCWASKWTPSRVYKLKSRIRQGSKALCRCRKKGVDKTNRELKQSIPLNNVYLTHIIYIPTHNRFVSYVLRYEVSILLRSPNTLRKGLVFAIIGVKKLSGEKALSQRFSDPYYTQFSDKRIRLLNYSIKACRCRKRGWVTCTGRYIKLDQSRNLD